MLRLCRFLPVPDVRQNRFAEFLSTANLEAIDPQEILEELKNLTGIDLA